MLSDSTASTPQGTAEEQRSGDFGECVRAEAAITRALCCDATPPVQGSPEGEVEECLLLFDCHYALCGNGCTHEWCSRGVITHVYNTRRSMPLVVRVSFFAALGNGQDTTACTSVVELGDFRMEHVEQREALPWKIAVGGTPRGHWFRLPSTKIYARAGCWFPLLGRG